MRNGIKRLLFPVRNYGTKSRHEVTDISCRGVNQAPVRRLLGVGLLLLAAQIGYCGVVAAASPAAPAFEETPCDVPNAANVAAGLRCGAVHVPRDYAHPESGTFALSLVIAKSAQQPALRDPVIYINGGPGEPLTIHLCGVSDSKTLCRAARSDPGRSARHRPIRA